MSVNKEVIYKKKSLPFHKVNNMTIVLDPYNAKTHELNSSAFFIWESFAEGASVTSVTSRLADRYNLTQENARQDALVFVEQLLGSNLIEIQ